MHRTTKEPEPERRVVDYRGTLERRHDFQVRLPLPWRPVRMGGEAPDGPMSRPLAVFVSETDLDANVEVRCAKIDRELDPLDLLSLHLEASQATVIDKRPMWTLGGNTGELLVHRPIEGGEAATLARVEKDADLVYFVFAHTTAEGYPKRAEMLGDIVRSFRLLHPAGGLAEALLPGGARFPVDHSFLFPSSFRMMPDPTADAALAGYELVSKQHGDAGGFIAVLAIARRATDHESAAEIAAWTQRALRKRGVELGPLVLSEAAPLAQDLPTQMATAEGTYVDAPAETELRVARHDQAWLVLARATPLRSANGPAWLAGTRAFTIVRERFATMPHPEPA